MEITLEKLQKEREILVQQAIMISGATQIIDKLISEASKKEEVKNES